jgi:peptide/nickel transport system permease protein
VNVRRLAARRVALAVLSIYLVFTLSFAFVALTPDPNIGSVRFSAGASCQGTPEEREACIESKIQAYREANNLDDPVMVRYVRWMEAMVTLDWGASTETGAPVLASIAFTLPYTLLYVVPAMLLSSAGGLAAGAALALRPEGWRERTGTAATYLAYAVPNFWIAAFGLAVVSKTYALPGSFIISWNPELQPGAPLFAPGTLAKIALPTLVLSTTLFATQLRYARAETLERLGTELVKVVRAKGYGDRGVARHVLRLTAPLLVSLFVVDLFGVVVVNVFVLEYVFDLPGFGNLTLRAIKGRDMPLLLGATMVIAFVGIAGNLLKDLATLALDPRIGDADR